MGFRKADGTFTKAYLAARAATRRRKKRRAAAVVVPPAPPPTNLMTGKSWTAGPSSTLSTAGGKARATLGASGTNPRIQKQITGLTNGATYKLNGTMYLGDSDNVRVRCGTQTGLPTSGMLFERTEVVPSYTFVNETFVMSGTTLYIGIIGVTAVPGRYCEIDDNFSLTAA